LFANAGEKTPANVPQNGQTTTKPGEKLREMFQKTTKTTTNAGDFPENVPQNG